MNEDFEKKLNQLASHDDQLIKWSKQVTEAIENLCHMDIESSELSEVKEALVSFVKSWRTFWSVFAPGKELTQNQKSIRHSFAAGTSKFFYLRCLTVYENFLKSSFHNIYFVPNKK